MATGAGLHLLAVLSTIFIGIIAFILNRSKFSTPVKSDLLLQFTFNSNGKETTEYNNLIDKFCRKSKLINAKAIGEGDTLELSYYVGFREKEETTEFVQKLRKIDGVTNVNLFFDEEYF